jgi:nitronate monooxygenase
VVRRRPLAVGGPSAHDAIVNQLCARLGIDAPIIQSGMGGVAGPNLAADVSAAGGLGIVGALMVPPDVVREHIRHVRSCTDRPFGVNIWLHEELLPPRRPDELDQGLVGRVQDTLNAMRVDRGLPPASGPPGALPDLIGATIDMVIEERVPVFSAGLGIPSTELVRRFHDVGTTVMAMVVDVDDALEAVRRGVDVVVAQGAEAGGHRSVGSKPSRTDAEGLGAIVLLPAVRDAVGSDVPVVAAGGIADGRGIAAAIVLGADGVLLGTRFLATVESAADEGWKKAVMAHDRPTGLTDSFTGQWARTLRNEYAQRYDEAAPGTLPSLLQVSAAGDIFAAARERHDVEMMPMYAGQSARLIDELSPAGELVRQLTDDAERILGRSIR